MHQPCQYCGEPIAPREQADDVTGLICRDCEEELDDEPDDSTITLGLSLAFAGTVILLVWVFKTLVLGK